MIVTIAEGSKATDIILSDALSVTDVIERNVTAFAPQKILPTQMEDLIARFDLDGVMAYMKLTDWTWQGEIPSKQRIVDFIWQLYNDIKIEKGFGYVSSGGFVLTFNTYHDCTRVELIFTPWRQSSTIQRS